MHCALLAWAAGDPHEVFVICVVKQLHDIRTHKLRPLEQQEVRAHGIYFVIASLTHICCKDGRVVDARHEVR